LDYQNNCVECLSIDAIAIKVLTFYNNSLNILYIYFNYIYFNDPKLFSNLYLAKFVEMASIKKK